MEAREEYIVKLNSKYKIIRYYVQKEKSTSAKHRKLTLKIE